MEKTASAQEAFQNAKCLLVAAVPLQHPAPTAELSLATDTSDTIVLQNIEIQNVELQNAENTKCRIAKRRITKRRILQNIETYKTLKYKMLNLTEH